VAIGIHSLPVRSERRAASPACFKIILVQADYRHITGTYGFL